MNHLNIRKYKNQFK